MLCVREPLFQNDTCYNHCIDVSTVFASLIIIPFLFLALAREMMHVGCWGELIDANKRLSDEIEKFHLWGKSDAFIAPRVCVCVCANLY